MIYIYITYIVLFVITLLVNKRRCSEANKVIAQVVSIKETDYSGFIDVELSIKDEIVIQRFNKRMYAHSVKDNILELYSQKGSYVTKTNMYASSVAIVAMFLFTVSVIIIVLN